MRRVIRLLLWLALLGATLTVLVVAGRGPLAGPDLVHPSSWPGWAAAREPVDAAMAMARTGLLVVTAYLLALTVLGGVAQAVAAPRLFVVVAAAGGPLVRRLLAGAVGVGLATSTLTPAMAATSPPPTAVMRLLDDAPPTTTTTPTTGPARPIAVVNPQPPAMPADADYVAQPGDSLWHIAAQHVEAVLRRPPTDREVAAYWRALVAANRHRLLAPSEPDLIYPGQRFRLP